MVKMPPMKTPSSEKLPKPQETAVPEPVPVPEPETKIHTVPEKSAESTKPEKKKEASPSGRNVERNYSAKVLKIANRLKGEI